MENLKNETECGLACMQYSTGLCLEAIMESHAILQWIEMDFCCRQAMQYPLFVKPNTFTIWRMCSPNLIKLSKGTRFWQIARIGNLFLIQQQQNHHHAGHSIQTWFQFLELPQRTNAGASLRLQLYHC